MHYIWLEKKIFMLHCAVYAYDLNCTWLYFSLYFNLSSVCPCVVRKFHHCQSSECHWTFFEKYLVFLSCPQMTGKDKFKTCPSVILICEHNPHSLKGCDKLQCKGLWVTKSMSLRLQSRHTTWSFFLVLLENGSWFTNTNCITDEDANISAVARLQWWSTSWQS